MFNKKCTKLVAAMGITLFAGAAQAVYMDIAVNGGFETGDFTGWAQFPGSLGALGRQLSHLATAAHMQPTLMSLTLLLTSSSRQIFALVSGQLGKQSISHSTIKVQRALAAFYLLSYSWNFLVAVSVLEAAFSL